jgi:hypothetical protein
MTANCAHRTAGVDVSLPFAISADRDSPFFHETVKDERGSGGCMTAEVRGSNPLSSTKKSAQIDVISQYAE